MPSLFEMQAGFRAAIAGDAPAPLLGRLHAPASVAGRMEIYRRHHRESFRRHLRGRYPTLEWLLGTDRLLELADLTLQRSPPRAPSMAEYGAALIETLRSCGDDLPPYAADVGRMDWHLGCLSVSLEHQPMALVTLAGIDTLHLPRLRFTLQPGLVFIQSAWPVDELLRLRLQDILPDRFTFEPCETHLQLRGARGAFSLNRLEPDVFQFRAGLAAGCSLADAATRGTQAKPGFDLSTALATLFAEGLVIAHSGENVDV
ncbi:DNA-binding domain-containing protein [Aestuariivirga litoralis]|nr:DNA-binding domain-containing protein [Aestuariivirga litoralis]